MPNPVPSITPEQRSLALEKAKQARIGMAEVRVELKEGRLTLEQALDDPRAQRMRLRSLLLALPGVGTVKAGQMLARAGVSEKRRVKGLGHVQRAEVLKLVEGMR